MAPADESDSSGRGRRSKVERLLEEYDLPGLGEELEHLWTADENRHSLRELATYLNQELLHHQLERADVQLLDGEAENIYRLLTADDVTRAERTRVRRRLEREGVDVDTLESNFVTYQAVRTYLKNHRDAEYTPDETEPLEREEQNLQQLRGRTATVTEQKVAQLRDSGHLAIGEFRTLVNIQVVCERCNTQHEVLALLEEGGCSCSKA